MILWKHNRVIRNLNEAGRWYRWAFALVGLFIAAPGNATPFEAHWVGERPIAVELRGVGTTYRLALVPNDDRGMFVGDYFGNRGIASLVLTARWGDDTRTLLPLRLWERPEGFSVDIHRIRVDTCNVRQRANIIRRAGDIGLALQRFYRAAALYALDDANRCQGYAQREVVQAWYERSYELMNLGRFFRLDPRAEAAMREHVPRYDVASYRRQSIGREIQVANWLKTDAWRDGRFEEALAINLGLVGALEDDEYRAIALELQGLNVEMLNDESDLLVEAASRTPDPGIPRSEPAFGITLSEVDLQAQLTLERDIIEDVGLTDHEG